MPDRFIRFTEVAEMLSITVRTVYRLIKDDPSFPAVVAIGGCKRISQNELMRYIQSRTNDGDKDKDN